MGSKGPDVEKVQCDLVLGKEKRKKKGKKVETDGTGKNQGQNRKRKEPKTTTPNKPRRHEKSCRAVLCCS
jgi:hypothetical protein